MTFFVTDEYFNAMCYKGYCEKKNEVFPERLRISFTFVLLSLILKIFNILRNKFSY